MTEQMMQMQAQMFQGMQPHAAPVQEPQAATTGIGQQQQQQPMAGDAQQAPRSE